MTDAQIWNALLAAIGTIVVGLLGLIGVQVKARHDLLAMSMVAAANAAVVEAEERTKYRGDVMERLRYAEKRADEAVAAAHRAQREIIDVRNDTARLEIENAMLKLRTQDCEQVRRQLSELQAENKLLVAKVGEMETRLGKYEKLNGGH